MVWRGASGTGDGSWNSLHDLSAWMHKGACKDFCVKVWFHCDLLCEAEPVAEQDSELCLGSGPLALWHRPSSSSLRHLARPNTTVWLPPRRMGSAPDCARSCAACC